jgi:hypothetical protein
MSSRQQKLKKKRYDGRRTREIAEAADDGSAAPKKKNNAKNYKYKNTKSNLAAAGNKGRNTASWGRKGAGDGGVVADSRDFDAADVGVNADGDKSNAIVGDLVASSKEDGDGTVDGAVATPSTAALGSEIDSDSDSDSEEEVYDCSAIHARVVAAGDDALPLPPVAILQKAPPQPQKGFAFAISADNALAHQSGVGSTNGVSKKAASLAASGVGVPKHECFDEDELALDRLMIGGNGVDVAASAAIDDTGDSGDDSLDNLLNL